MERASRSPRPSFRELFQPKLLTVLREGYGLAELKADALAGLTVAIVALPLSMAIAISSGVAPQVGLFSAIVGGFVISAIGGSRFQIGGPAGAFIVLVAACVADIGASGLMTACILADVLHDVTDTVNMVNAPEIAKAKGIVVADTRTHDTSEWPSAITITLTCEAATHTLTGTLFAGRDPRIVRIDTVPIEAALTPHMLLVHNNDKPGMIGALGTLLAEAGINIADFRLGRVGAGQTAVALVAVDTPVSDALLTKLKAVPQVTAIQRLVF